MNKILLIFASFYSKKDLPEKKRIFWEPLGIAYLAAYLRKFGYVVDILYPLIEDMSEHDIIEWLNEKSKSYFMIGLSTSDFTTKDIKRYVDILNGIKYSGVVVLGGMGPTCKWEEFVKTGVDAVIIGEGEKTLLNLAQAVEHGKDYRNISGVAYLKDGKPYRNGKVDLIENLDENVFPARDISQKFLEKFDVNQIHIQIQTSRGCFGDCSFCSISKFLLEQGGTRYRCRTAQNVSKEIMLLNRQYGFIKFDFMDENFFPFDKKKSVEKAIILKQELEKIDSNIELFVQCHLQAVSNELLDILKSLNITSIFVGIDSFQSSELFLFNKKYTREDVFNFLDMVIQSPYSFDIKSKFRIKTGFINFTPISTLDGLYENGIIFKKYKFSSKKLMRKLKVNVGNHMLEYRISSIFSEFSNQNYFMSKDVEIFYTALLEFYNDYDYIRRNMRNIENFYMNENSSYLPDNIEKIIKLRETVDDLFFEFYFCKIKEIQDSISYGSIDVKRKLLNLYEKFDAIKENLKIDDSINYPINDRGV